MPLTQEEIKCAIARTVKHCAYWLRLGFDCWLRTREARRERREGEARYHGETNRQSHDGR
jgi:hypothetical protein